MESNETCLGFNGNEENYEEKNSNADDGACHSSNDYGSRGN